MLAAHLSPSRDLQKQKTLGLCENEFKYRLTKRDESYEKFAAQIRNNMDAK
jgi:hypothetical protein